MRRAGRICTLASVVAMAAALAGCGFTPMYAEPGVSGGIQHIQVVAPRGRIGYLLGESLDDDFGNAKGAKPQYRLEMVLTEGRQAHGLNATDVAQRYAATTSLREWLVSSVASSANREPETLPVGRTPAA